MKALIDKCYDMLAMGMYLPGLPSAQATPSFYDDFKTYCQGQEWTSFMQKQVGSRSHDVSSSLTAYVERNGVHCPVNSCRVRHLLRGKVRLILLFILWILFFFERWRDRLVGLCLVCLCVTRALHSFYCR